MVARGERGDTMDEPSGRGGANPPAARLPRPTPALNGPSRSRTPPIRAWHM